MTRFAPFAAALAAFVLTPAAMAQGDGEAEVKQNAATEKGGTPAKLISFDAEKKLLDSSTRLRVWRSHLAYKLTVDAEGEVIDCELTEKFRRNYVNIKLCQVLSDHHTFEPAHNAAGEAVEGSYYNRISYMDLREKQ